MSEYTVDDLLNECLYGKKPKARKRKKKIKESKTDVKKILEAEDDKDDKDNTTEDAASLDSKDATAKKSREDAEKKEAKGELVMTVSLTISDVDQGKQEIGANEYASITNMSSLLSLYDINSKNLTDPKKATDTLSLSVQEQVSKSDKNNISFVMRSNVDDTISINVLVNELGQTFDDITKAITYFNTQYQNNILNIINKKIRA